MRVLGFESSCDEPRLRWSKRDTASSLRWRNPGTSCTDHGGVVPEIAGRAHAERIGTITDRALAEAGTSFAEIDAVAVAHRPGLIGSVLVGVAAAKSVAWRLGVPLIGVHHVEAHLWSGLLEESSPPWPALGLVVSGGHSSLYRVDAPFRCTVLGRTIDDAVGEAYDKAAALLGLGWPGGVRVDQAAQNGNDEAYQFPMPNSRGGLDFRSVASKQPCVTGSWVCQEQPSGSLSHSLSKNAPMPRHRFKQRSNLDARTPPSPARHPDVQSLLIGGGVSANSHSSKELESFAEKEGLVLDSPMQWCVDNAAMVAGLGWIRLQKKDQRPMGGREPEVTHERIPSG